MTEEKQPKRQPSLAGLESSSARQACEIYSRVVGYLRPVSQWNDGKQAEFGERKTYDRQLEEV